MPIERQTVIDFMQNDAYKPLAVQELMHEFELEGSEEFRDFVKLLNNLEDIGEVVRTRTDRYGVPERMNLVVGRLQIKARGFGFLIPDVAGDPDLYIPATDLGGAMNGDKVIGRIEKESGGARREGKVIRVLERANTQVVGTFTKYRDHAFVTPADKRFPQDIFVSLENMLDAHDGYMVVVDITSFPTTTRGPEGKIVEVLGHPDAPGIDILAVVKKYGLPEEFPEDVMLAAENIPLELSEADYAGRRDLRSEVIVTIDGEDAKDLDDAVHVKRLPNGNYLLGVHIADVGYYVKEGGPLDKEAFKRGTSVYLVDRVIPMLPQRLSNNICSLNPHVDRMTLSCEMEINGDGKVVAHDVFPSVIKSLERMTYNNVRKIIEREDEKVLERYDKLLGLFDLMAELAQVLRNKRMHRGAVDFDFDEIKIRVDDLGHPTEIGPRARSVAERLIEEFMLAANETVAEHFNWLNVPFIYRVHEEPTMEKMIDFSEFVHNFGYHVKGLGNKIHPRSLQAILKAAEGSREQRVIATLMLRSMKQARYSPVCDGHFGLAAEFYTHFTSPIRRYPDLMIHRIIREVQTAPLSANRETTLRDKVDAASRQASERERVAQDAEREVDMLKMVEYMMDHIDEEFDGIIRGVTQFGLFIQLGNGIEGLVHISYLTDDYYVLNERQMALIGERTRRVFRLGDPVRVSVAGASKPNLSIDFALISHHREGTLVRGVGGDAVVYDEDLSPKQRKLAITEREERARYSPAAPRFEGDKAFDEKGKFRRGGGFHSGREGGQQGGGGSQGGVGTDSSSGRGGDRGRAPRGERSGRGGDSGDRGVNRDTRGGGSHRGRSGGEDNTSKSSADAGKRQRRGAPFDAPWQKSREDGGDNPRGGRDAARGADGTPRRRGAADAGDGGYRDKRKPGGGIGKPDGDLPRSYGSSQGSRSGSNGGGGYGKSSGASGSGGSAGGPGGFGGKRKPKPGSGKPAFGKDGLKSGHKSKSKGKSPT